MTSWKKKENNNKNKKGKGCKLEIEKKKKFFIVYDKLETIMEVCFVDMNDIIIIFKSSFFFIIYLFD